jgi:tetratricopeptide (TPR) repeat protein
MRFLVPLLSVALVAPLLSAYAQYDDQLAQAVALYKSASRGERGEVERAIAAFEALARRDPSQPLYGAYLGSAMALRGRDAWMPWNRIRHTEEGLERIDQALAALRPVHDSQLLRGVPVALETKLVAGMTYIKLPDSVFHRRAAGVKLIQELLRHPALAAAPAEFRAAVNRANETVRETSR